MGLDITSLPPCPTCGAEEWSFHIDLRPIIKGSAVKGSASVVGNLDVSDATGLTDSATTTIYPETAKAEISAHTPSIHVEDLPTEVIAEALQIGINILRPVDGRWAIEVAGFGIIGYVGVGDLAEGLFESSAWIEELALRWEEKLRADD